MKLHFWNTLKAEIDSLESQNKVHMLLLQETVRVLELENNKDDAVFLLNLIKEVLKLDSPMTETAQQEDTAVSEESVTALKESISEVTAGISNLLAESLKQIDDIKNSTALVLDSVNVDEQVETPVN